jgi:hypothetical protein
MTKKGRHAANLTEQQIRYAMSRSMSNRAAARVLNVNYYTYRHYARLYFDVTAGKTLFELHKNEAGKGIKKFFEDSREPKLTDLLKEGMPLESYSIEKLKARLIFEGVLECKCNRCNFSELRVLDMKPPLLLNYKDGNKSNWTIANLEFLCYNCYFLYVGDLISKKQEKHVEDFGAPALRVVEPEWELDDFYLEHFRSLGIEEKEGSEGNEFIDTI